MKKVSIVVPYYNSQKTIKTCIGSVLSSDYPNFEVICVNDGGTDDSTNILKELNDSRIVIHEALHGGVSRARNIGLDLATGDYIQFVDSDDTIEPNMISKMVKSLEENDADIVVCNYTHPSIKNYLSPGVYDLTSLETCLKYYQTTFAGVVPWNKLYKRSIITNKFDESVSFCEDDLFGLSNLFNAKRLVCIGDLLYHYYVPPKEDMMLSTINKMASEDKFWESKNTYWYKRNDLVARSKKTLNNLLNTKYVDDFAYTRAFDFMIWEILILNCVGVNNDGLKIEMNNIFREKAFLHAMDLRKKYGLKYRKMKDKELTKKVNLFVDKTIEMQNTFGDKDNAHRPFYLSVLLFIKMFIVPYDKIDDTDILGQYYNILINNNTSEANFINNMVLE
ncbi:MAG: glycosyltransferase family 2 protein [Anaeroplasmataceae bacterium]